MLEIEEQLARYGAALERDLLLPRTGRDLDVPILETPRRGRRRGLLIAVAALVAVSVVVALIVGIRTDGTPSRVVSPAPSRGVFSETTGSVLLFSDGIDGVTAIDLDHRLAGRRVIKGERAGDQAYRDTITGGHLVVGWDQIWAQSLADGRSKKIADATIYVPAAEPGEVWTVTWQGGRIGAGGSTVRRITVNGKVTFSSQSLDTNDAYPLLGVPGGLVVAGTQGVAVWNATTNVTVPLGPGRAVDGIASNGHLLAWCVNTCADLHAATLPRTGLPTSPHVGGQRVAFSNDGHWMAYVRPTPGDTSELVLRDLATDQESTIATGLGQYGSVAWSSDNQQLFYKTDNSITKMQLGRYNVRTKTSEEAEIPVHGAIGGLVVLPRAQARTFFPRKSVRAIACPPAGIMFPSGRHGVCSFRF